MKAYQVHLKLESPLLLAGVANGDENSGRSLHYIPGASLRGALIARYGAGSHRDLLADPLASALFFSGKVRYLNAYPELNGSRALPAPASWRRAKEDQEEAGLVITDFALGQDPEKETRLKKPFVALTEPGVPEFSACNPETELHLHIGGEGRGTVRQGQNTVFQYEVLSAGQSFIAIILASDEVDLQRVLDLIPPGSELPLGRSRSAEYGLVSIQKIRTCEPTWQEAPAFRPSGQPQVLTLLSDAVLRDAHGQPTLDFDLALSQALGKPVKHQQAFIKPALVGGFNRKWGLPLPQSPAVGMGSVFVYQAGTLPEQALQHLLENGLGELTLDGFGRLALGWPGFESLKWPKPLTEPLPKDAPPKLPALCSSSQQLAHRMAHKLLLRKLDTKLLQISTGLPLKGSLPNHQLSRLRSVVRRALDLPDKRLQPVLDFLNEKNLKPTALKQFRSVRLQDKRLYYWVEDLASEKDDVFGKGYLDFKTEDLPQVAGVCAEITPLLRQEVTLRLIEAVVNFNMKNNPGGER
jgi:CRISPR-associated protein Csx10